MKLLRIGLVAMLAAMFPVYAQGPGGAEGYDKMELKAGRMVLNINAAHPLESLNDGARIVLKASDGSKPEMPILANTITFTWKEGQQVPVIIKMVGKVDIKHPQINITADQADWNLESGDLVFSGNPKMDSASLQGLRADKVRINLETGAAEILQVEVDEVPFGGPGMEGGSAPIPGELTEADITDWAGFINTLKAQGEASGDNPGKQVLSRLDEKTRGFLKGVETPTLLENKGALLKQLNGVVRKSGLFKRSAWEGITLSEEINTLLSIDPQTPEQQLRQNRLLLHAAYPTMVAAP